MKKKVHMAKKSLIMGILQNKCPACRSGNFFISGNPYDFNNLGKMYDNCPNCNQKYTLEPGFYFGAAYVSYALSVALFVAAVLVVYILVPEPTISNYVISIITPTVILAPILFRWSRIIWATMFIPFGGKKL